MVIMMLLIGAVAIRNRIIYGYLKEPQFTGAIYVVIILKSISTIFCCIFIIVFKPVTISTAEISRNI